MSPSSYNNEAGFTLIEVLAALAVFSLIAATLFASLQFAGRAWRTIVVHDNDAEDIATAQRIIRQCFEQVRLDTSVSHNAVSSLKMEFSTAAPLVKADGPVRYRLSLSDKPPAALQLEWKLDSASMNSTSSNAWQQEVLLRNITNFSIDLPHLADAETAGVDIHPYSDKRDGGLIRVNVEFPPSDHRAWPPLWIRPYLTAPTNCQFDLVSRRCRTT